MSENGLPSHRIIESMRRVRLSRRRFLQSSAAFGASLPLVGSGLALSGTARAAAPNFDPYPFGTDPIADNIEDAIAFWLAETATGADDTSPDVVLTADELAELKDMNVKVGHSWYAFYVPAIVGWNRFWKDEVEKWAGETVVYDVEGRPERDIAGAELMINGGVRACGTLAVDWVVFSEAMKKFHAAGVATTSIVAPSSAYYPTTCTIMPDQVENARDLVLPMAQKLNAEGIAESEVVLLPQSRPAYFDVARTIGFKEGLELPEVQALCKLTLVEEKPVANPEEAVAATAAALQQYPNAHFIGALGHWYVGASAAIRDAGRRDVWVAAFDLDEGTATELMGGGWPVYCTYSLPIAQSGIADASVMGKILLGKSVPLVVKPRGTVTTPDNVAEAWAHDWGGEELPWSF